MPSKEFYSFESFKDAHNEDVQNQHYIRRDGHGNISPMQLLDLYIMINESQYGETNTLQGEKQLNFGGSKCCSTRIVCNVVKSITSIN